MELPIQAPRGTADVLPDDSYRWREIEKRLAEVCGSFGYREIRVPTFEHTELFQRGVGETTDVVGKEMYTMADRSGRSITLRPEGTAGVARSFLQHGVLDGPLPVRAFYLLSCFRYEKPQSGRLREFHQLGVELFGAPSADADAEVIQLAGTALARLGIGGAELEINSVGCAVCRPKYREALQRYFGGQTDRLCDTCKVRLTRNPLRILDCKSPECRAVADRAPVITDHLCPDCRLHLGDLKGQLESAGMVYTENPRIVRGLDYYSRTVFEFIHRGAGAQGTVCGGGRYDGLTEYLGGASCPGIGFGMGLERILLVMEDEGVELKKPDGPALFVAFVGESAHAYTRDLVYSLRQNGVFAMYDVNARSLKAQMKCADRMGARCTLVLGDGELESGMGKLRDMNTKEEIPSPIAPGSLLKTLRGGMGGG